MTPTTSHDLGCTCTENTTPGAGYTPCRQAVSAAVEATGGMGCATLCEVHFRAYHKGATLEAIAAAVVARRNRRHRCAQCGAGNAAWVSGAGQALCHRHANNY